MNLTDMHTSPAEKHKAELAKIKDAADGFLPEHGIIAGGALASAFTRREIQDVDVYFRSKDDFIQAVRDAYDDGMWCVLATDRAVTFQRHGHIVQLMCFDWFVSPAAVFDAFDFTGCMAAYDIDAELFVFHEEFFKHAAQRHLKFHSGTRFPYGSLLRVLKYQGRGYSIGKSDLLRIALCCSTVKLESWDDLAKAIGGQYGEKVNLGSDRPFSIEAALEILADSDVTVPSGAEEQPDNADELLVKIGMLPASILAEAAETFY
jgi:hypothetical protein